MAVIHPIPRNESRLLSRTLRLIEGLKDRWGQLWADREESERAAFFLDSTQIEPEHLPKNPAEDQKHWDKKTKITVDLANAIRRAIADTYFRPAQRRADSEDASEWFRDHVWEWGLYGLDEIFLDIDGFSIWEGSIAIEPRYTRDETEPAEDGVEPLYYRRHEFEVLPRPDPRRAQAVVLLMARDGNGHLTHHYWDEDVFCVLRDWEIQNQSAVIESQGWELGRIPLRDGIFEHGIGFLPIVFRQEERPSNRFHSPPRHRRLKPQCEAINKLWTEFGHAVRLEAGQPWTSSENPTNLARAPDVVIQTPGGQFGIAQSGTKLAEMESGIRVVMENTALMMDMAPGSLVMEPKTGRAGVSIVASQSVAEAIRNRRRPGWLRVEKHWHKAAAAIYQAFSGKPAPLNARVSVTHQRPDTIIASAEQRDNLQWQLDQKMIDRSTAHAEARPDLDDVERARREEAAASNSERPVDAPGPPGEMPADPMSQGDTQQAPPLGVETENSG